MIATTTTKQDCSYSNPVSLAPDDMEFASSTCISYATSSYSGAQIENGFTYGEVIVSTFLFLLLVINIFNTFYYLTRGFRIKRKTKK